MKVNSIGVIASHKVAKQSFPKNKPLAIQTRSGIIRGVLENIGSKKLIILTHGFTGDWRGPDNIFIKLSERLQNEGFAVLRFSFMGTPPSDGDFIDMTVESETQDLKMVIEFTRKQGYRDISLLGESLGGTVILDAYNDSIKNMVFWYPTFKFSEDSFVEYLKPQAQKELTRYGYVLTDGFKVGKRFIDQIPNVDIFEKIKDITCPILFLHGDSDTDVPCVQSKKAFELANEPKEFHLIKGANHCFRNEQEEVIKLTIGFLKSNY